MSKKLPDNVDYQRKDMFKLAFEGIVIALKEEKNLQYDACIALIVVICGCFFKVTLQEWCFLIFAISQVLIAEMVNTLVENIVDVLFPMYHSTAKKIKDMSCGMVLIACIFSAILGLMIFIPYLI